MRRPLALVCIAALLIAAFALPLAGWGVATLGADLWVPAAGVARLAPGAPPIASPTLAAVAALVSFRGPPSRARSLDPVSEESPWKEARCARAGWPESCCT